MSLSLAAEVLQRPYNGPDTVFTGVSIDSRTVQAGELFVALKGPHFDGHQFLADAISAGAAGTLVSALASCVALPPASMQSCRDVETTLPIVHVKDTRLALGHLAGYWRQQFDIPVIAVTGSNGKTTVKDMIACILGVSRSGWTTQGNQNNDIGVPLTLLKLRKEHRFAVIEMGMNHRGEINYLSHMAQPTVAVITNAAQAHLEGLGSIEQIAQAKGEIFSGLADDGIAIVNADDRYGKLWCELASPRKCLTFGLDNPADVTARYQLSATGSTISLKTKEGEINMSLSIPGKHNVMNAMAAATASIAVGAKLTDIRNGLEKLKAVAGRMEIKDGMKGARILDDTYNANPASVAAGLEVLRESKGESVLVLGDMAELGEASADIHRRVGDLARTVGVNQLLAVGPLSRHAARAFGKEGRHFKNNKAVADALIDLMHSDMTILVKGSRRMNMEQVVNSIIKKKKGNTKKPLRKNK